MKYAQPIDRQLVVLELEGAVVHDHTPSELIRAGFPLEPERYERALDMYQYVSRPKIFTSGKIISLTIKW